MEAVEVQEGSNCHKDSESRYRQETQMGGMPAFCKKDPAKEIASRYITCPHDI
ncbi:hypothetical protein OZ401_004757 (plasmid) [Candidatus Chlorohelix allophototropha]|uniref:Uncharacterized protein n=1 Tax=Candidatus Chlorohelix allophototropha TaxID=3003348 RepID=A0ABY9BAT3_9CHLR|nr:hypothetical protein OZ401_004757 [Chloroflexota bacterium L227-S17]